MTRLLSTASLYLEDCALSFLQRRCSHPGRMVAVDILEGCADGIEVKYCRRCGSVQTLWEPQPTPGQPSRYIILDHCWRRPDPHLWRDPVAAWGRFKHIVRGAFAASLCALLIGCTAQQLQTASADVQAACNDVMPIVSIAELIPTANTIAAGVKIGCTTASGLAQLASDPTSAEWLGIQKQMLTALMPAKLAL